MSNGQVWKIHRKVDCHSVNVIYYSIYKMCNEKEAYIEKTKGDRRKGFKVRQGIQNVSSRIMYTIVVLRITA